MAVVSVIVITQGYAHWLASGSLQEPVAQRSAAVGGQQEASGGWTLVDPAARHDRTIPDQPPHSSRSSEMSSVSNQGLYFGGTQMYKGFVLVRFGCVQLFTFESSV